MAYNDQSRSAGYTPSWLSEFPVRRTAGTSSTGAAVMTRSDSGYVSNVSMSHSAWTSPPSAYGHRHTIPEEEDMMGEYNPYLDSDQQGDMYGMDLEYHDAQLDKDYTVANTGAHMPYPEESRPRTMDVETYRDRDLDDGDAFDMAIARNDPFLKQGGAEVFWSHQRQHQSAYDFGGQSYPLDHPDYQAAIPSPTSSAIDLQDNNADYDLPLPSPTTAYSPSTPTATAAPDTHITAQVSTTPVTRFACLAKDCTKQFNRAADLDRHMKQVHYKEAVTPLFCDYTWCPRYQQAFRRPDHFRDHLREFHREDLLKRPSGGSKKAKSSPSITEKEAAPVDPQVWWRQRRPKAVYDGWWRCSKCLTVKVDIETDEYRCPRCGNYCEGERQAVRRLPLVCDKYAECFALPDGEAEKFLSPQRFREHLRDVHGEDVPKDEGKEGQAELASDEWWRSREASVVYGSMWRCTRCLEGVDSAVHGFECPCCGFLCEEARSKFRAA